MRQFKQAGPVGDAVPQSADAVDMFLVIGARRQHHFRVNRQNPADRLADSRDDRRRLGRHDRLDLEQIADFVAESRPCRGHTLHQRIDLFLHLVDILLNQKPPVDGDHAAIRNAG